MNAHPSGEIDAMDTTPAIWIPVWGHIEALPAPRTRNGFRTQIFERYQRRREVDATIGEMFILGIRTAQVGAVLDHLKGLKPTPTIVSRVFHKLEDAFEIWKKRPLLEHYVYQFADGTYFSVIYDDAGCQMPILAIIGIRPDGQRENLAFSVGDRENQTAWETRLDELKTRGLKTVDLSPTGTRRS